MSKMFALCEPDFDSIKIRFSGADKQLYIFRSSSDARDYVAANPEFTAYRLCTICDFSITDYEPGERAGLDAPFDAG
jgi:hypothetical protein